MAVRYDLEGQKRAYEKWAPIYDAVYLKMLESSQRRLAEVAAACGPDILEVGVGTGLVLRYYPAGTRVVGVDLSPAMLARARDKAIAARMDHVRGLAAMDACRLGFADARFDAVTLPFVITLVPDPEGALDECARVLRPGGEIVIASRLGAEDGPQAAIEAALAPLVKRVGWSSAFKLSRLEAWAARDGRFRMVEVTNGLFFKVVRFAKSR